MPADNAPPRPWARTMNWVILLVLTGIVPSAFSSGLFAADIGTSAVTFNLQQISEISITGAPTLTISSAVAGQQPQPVTDATSRYAISTNGTNARIIASIDREMPANTSLEIRLAAPGSGTSLGYVTLSPTPADVVTGISHVASGSRTVTYRFSATTAAEVFSASYTVTFTLTD